MRRSFSLCSRKCVRHNSKCWREGTCRPTLPPGAAVCMSWILLANWGSASMQILAPADPRSSVHYWPEKEGQKSIAGSISSGYHNEVNVEPVCEFLQSKIWFLCCFLSILEYLAWLAESGWFRNWNIQNWSLSVKLLWESCLSEKAYSCLLLILPGKENKDVQTHVECFSIVKWRKIVFEKTHVC